MSRAFVRETDANANDLPDRPVSPEPNFVTATGLRRIEAEVRRLEHERQAARDAGDDAVLARVTRDLRYWQQRQASARLVEVAAAPEVVRFGVRVLLRTAQGTERAFRIVGEDEAEPAAGSISWASPLARSMLGRGAGDTVEFQGQPAEIVRLEA